MDRTNSRYKQTIILMGCLIFLVILFIRSDMIPTSKEQKVEDVSRNDMDGDTKKPKLNVLLLIADDMRPEIGAFLDSKKRPWLNSDISTPNLDVLALRSLVLKQAYAQVALCNPSRTSFLTSRRPDTTYVYRLQNFRHTAASHVITLPQYFRQNGYTTTAVGKIFHQLVDGTRQDLEHSWISLNDTVTHFPVQIGKDHSSSWIAVSDEERKERPLYDDIYLDRALTKLKEHTLDYKNSNKHFFLAVGLRKPHLPFVCPQEYFDKYPITEISKVKNNFCPHKMVRQAFTQSCEIFHYNDTIKREKKWHINSTFSTDKELELRRAYYSCVSYTDHNFGMVLDLLDELGMRDHTVVAFLGDHGWHLGENGLWGKNTNFEVATHAPAMLSIPGRTDDGVESNKLAEFVDLFPSLVEAAGFPALPQCPAEHSADVPLCSEGSSWLRLIEDPDTAHWKTRVFSQYQFPESSSTPRYMGYSMRTHRYRYNEWVPFTMGGPKKWPRAEIVELYDMVKDPMQTYNRAGDPRYAEDVRKLSNQLHQGWQGALPNMHNLPSLVYTVRSAFDIAERKSVSKK